MFQIPALLCAILFLLSACQDTLCLCVGSCHHVICTSLFLCVCSLSLITEMMSLRLLGAQMHVQIFIYIRNIYTYICISIYVCVCMFITYHTYLCQCPVRQNKLWLSLIPLRSSCFKRRLTSQQDLGA